MIEADSFHSEFEFEFVEVFVLDGFLYGVSGELGCRALLIGCQFVGTFGLWAYITRLPAAWFLGRTSMATSGWGVSRADLNR